MSKADKTEAHVALALRVPANLYARVEAFKKTLDKERPGSRSSMSDAIRVLILKGLEK
jgi:hypothetical protein